MFLGGMAVMNTGIVAGFGWELACIITGGILISLSIAGAVLDA